MNKLLITITMLLVTLQSFGQVTKVKILLDSSFLNVKSSWNSADKALDELQKCNISTSLTDLQFNAGKAETKLEEAAEQANLAETEADGAEGEALNISCTEAKEDSGKAESFFKKAKNKFGDASSSLVSVTYEEDISMVIDYLNSAISDIEKGLDYLKKGTDELQTALDKLHGCR